MGHRMRKYSQYIKGHVGCIVGPGPVRVLQWTLTWPYNTSNMALYILAIFSHSMQQKGDQGTLGTHRWTPIWSWTRLGHSMDPAMALLYNIKGHVWCIVGPWQGPLKDPC